MKENEGTSNARFPISTCAVAQAIRVSLATLNMVRTSGERAATLSVLFLVFLGWTDERTAGYENSEKRSMVAA